MDDLSQGGNRHLGGRDDANLATVPDVLGRSFYVESDIRMPRFTVGSGYEYARRHPGGH